MWRTKGSDFESLVYASGLVFWTQHLNVDPCNQKLSQVILRAFQTPPGLVPLVSVPLKTHFTHSTTCLDFYWLITTPTTTPRNSQCSQSISITPHCQHDDGSQHIHDLCIPYHPQRQSRYNCHVVNMKIDMMSFPAVSPSQHCLNHCIYLFKLNVPLPEAVWASAQEPFIFEYTTQAL